MDKAALYSKAFLERIHGLSEKDFMQAISRLKFALKKREEMHLYPRVLRNVIASLEYQENATVVSARELDKTTEADILKKLKKHFPEISKDDVRFKIDEKILGGIEISYRDFLFDGTVKGMLKKLAEIKK